MNHGVHGDHGENLEYEKNTKYTKERSLLRHAKGIEIGTILFVAFVYFVVKVRKKTQRS